MIEKFKAELKKKGNKNFTFVKIRTPHTCANCLKTLPTGIECLTVNPKMGSRRWICSYCVQALLDLYVARSALASVAFGDEGGYMACFDWVSECENYFSDML